MNTPSLGIRLMAAVGLVVMMYAGLGGCGGGSQPVTGGSVTEGSADEMTITPRPPSQGRPDLRVERLAVSDGGSQPGASFTLSATVSNAGDGESAATTLRYYRSTDPTITDDDTVVGTRPLRGLSTPGTSFKLIRLRAPTTRGTYYYGACVEPVDGEVETGNNCSPAAELVVR